MDYVYIILLIIGFRMFRFYKNLKKVKILANYWDSINYTMKLNCYRFHLIYKGFDFKGSYSSIQKLDNIDLRDMVIQYEKTNGLIKKNLGVQFDCLMKILPDTHQKFEFDVTMVSDNHI
jgi:hypothetical protein